MSVDAVWNWLTAHGPATHAQIGEGTGVTGTLLSNCLRGMKNRGSAIFDGERWSAGKHSGRRIKWASKAERVAFYSRQRQRRVLEEGGARLEAYRAKRRATDAKRRANRQPSEAERQAGLKRAQQIVRKMKEAEARAKMEKQRQQEGAAQDRRDQSRADKARLSDSLASVNQNASSVVEYETVEQWLARGGQIHRLAPHEVSQPFQRIGFNNQVLGRD